MFELKVKTKFAAAHRLQMVSQKCENLHGHNWKIEAYVQGENLNSADVLMDFGDLKLYLRDIIETLDHTYLNELTLFDHNIPSSENIAKYIAKTLQKKITEPGIKVTKVSAWESDNSCATYLTE